MNKQSLILYIVLLILFLNTTLSFGQCVVCVDAPPLITCGETATLTGDGFLTSAYEDNFNNGIGALWSSVSIGGSTTSPCTGASSVTTVNCAGTGSVPAGDFLWWGQGAAVPRQATTIPIPVPAGGDVIFEFKMEGQGGSCDGPDLIGEGTMLQYRVGVGVWQDVPATMWPFNLNPMPYTNKAYFCPTNPALQSFTNWNQYSIPIPAAAFSANTQFRWRQISPTSSNWDFWGLDNVNISPSSAGGASYTWNPGGAGQTLNVSPTSLTNYTFTYDNNGISCSTTVTVDVAPPIVNPVIVPNPLNPCPNAIDLNADVSFNSCNYNVYLYDNGGDGWTTVPQTSTSIDNRIEVYVDGILVNTITMNNGYGPFVYSFPVTTGGTFETVFLTGGPNPAECAYFIEDNQGQLITNGAGSIISAMGLITSPSSPFWPVPAGLPPSGGFTVVPGNFGPVNTVCPTTNPYTYSWSISPSGSTAGISTPNNQSTVVTTASTQNYQVVATDVNNSGCIATGLVNVIGSGGSWDFTNISPNPACEGDCIDLNFTSTVSSGAYNILLEMIDANGTTSYNAQINSSGNNIGTGLPINICPSISAAVPNVIFNILSLVDASDPNNCEIPITNASQVVTFTPQPNAGNSSTIDFCANDITNYDLSTYLGTADNFGDWTPPTGVPITNGLTFNFNPQTDLAGVYTYTVANAPCTSDLATITVGLITPPNAGATTNQVFCQNASPVDLATLLGAPDPNGIWVDPLFNPSSPPIGTATFSFNPAADPPGIYTYTVTDASSTCPDESANVIVNINALPTVGVSSTNANICVGQSTCLDFALTGAPNFSIDIWDGSSSSIVIVDANGLDVFGNCISVSPVNNTTYSITTITDNNGCQSFPNTAATISVNNQPNAGVSSVLNICSDDISIYPLQNELGGGQDLTGYWLVPFLPNPLPNSPNFDYNPQTMIAGAYTYTVVAAPCPDAIASVTVNLIPAANAGAANNQDICINNYSAINLYDLNNTLIGADGGGFWCAGIAGGAPIASLIDPNTYGAGTFQFSYQVPGIPPCANDNTTIALTINPEPVINTFTSNIPTVSQSYPISLMVDMAVGTPPFTINLVDDDAPSNPYAISIPSPNMNGSVSAVPNVIPVTTYSITGITDGNGCTTTSVLTVPVTVDPYPIIDPFNTATSAVCEGTIPSVSMTLTQGEAPVTVDYSYNGITYTEVIGIVGSVAPLAVNIPLDITNLNNGTNTITIISVTDNSGVPSPNNLIPNPVVITIHPNPVVTFGQDDEICFGQPAILEFGFLVGTAPFTVDYTINGPSQTPLSFPANGTQTHILTPDPAPGVNTYNMIQVTDVNGCQSLINATSPVTITVNPTPILDITISGSNPICVGETSALFFPVTSGTPPYNLSYLAGTTSSTANVDAAGNIVSTGTTQPISPIITTDYTLISVTDAKGCVNTLSNSANLIVNELPLVDISGTTEICEQDVAQLYFNFTAGTSPWTVDYTINNPPSLAVTLSNNSDSIAVSPTTTTVYTVNSVSDINCTSPIIDAATITVNPLPEIVVSGGGSVCDDGSKINVIITTTSGTPTFNVEYTIGINNELASNIGYQHVISTSEAGVYSVTKATDSKGCIAKSISGNATVNINPIPEANIIAYPQPADITNPLIYFIDQSLLHVGGVWDFGDGNTALSNFDKISHIYKDTGTYIVALEVMTDSGCAVTAYQTIIIDPAFRIYIPTAFTPNNDLYNDYFLPIVDGVQEYDLRIYDRFGNRVFSTDQTNEAWDGKANNGTGYAVAGHYVYNIIIIDFKGKERAFQGGVTLIR